MFFFHALLHAMLALRTPFHFQGRSSPVPCAHLLVTSLGLERGYKCADGNEQPTTTCAPVMPQTLTALQHSDQRQRRPDPLEYIKKLL